MNQKKNFFELITEVIGWISIAISPLLICSVIGLIICSIKPDKKGFICAITLAGLGLIAGIIWATRIWKKEGTIHFLSKIRSSENNNEENTQ
jgi:dipeptide/tripeptide permease